MRTVKTTEKFDKDGNLIERVTETTETYETSPLVPYMPSYPSVPYYPLNPITNPLIPWCGSSAVTYVTASC